MSVAPLRVLVCGGRDYDDRLHLFVTLNEVYAEAGPRMILMQGGAGGADGLAALWCLSHNVECLTFPADWTTHGRAAGPLRNSRMIAEGRPDLVIAFPGGRGTADMVRKAHAAGIPVEEIAPATPVPAQGVGR